VTDGEPADSSGITHYDFSGIDERHGRVPPWLAVVYVALVIWMVYYLVRFWTDKG
jgi:hypothetical protein